MPTIYQYSGSLQTGQDSYFFEEQVRWLHQNVLEKDRGRSLQKLFLFYMENPRDPVLIRDLGSRLDLHPGKNRFLGCSLRANPPEISSVIFSENSNFNHYNLNGLKLLDQFEYRRSIKHYVPFHNSNWDGKEQYWNQYWNDIRLTIYSGKNVLSVGSKTSSKQLNFRTEDFKNFFDCLKYIFDNRQKLIS